MAGVSEKRVCVTERQYMLYPCFHASFWIRTFSVVCADPPFVHIDPGFFSVAVVVCATCKSKT